MLSVACKKKEKCDGMGTLHFSNNRSYSLDLKINGGDHWVEPNQSIDISLKSGPYHFEITDSQNTPWVGSNTTIKECETTNLSL